ncbi:MAG: M48 family metallopeptidase [Oscillospiraceae bacterium]|nr:M48 family metallopeptidase [Oscillospiraceae bacterium]
MMDYELIRSGRHTLAVEIGAGGRVIVRAPRLYPQKKIDRFLESRAEWIREHVEKQKLRERNRPEPDAEEKRRLTEAAKTAIPPKVEYYSSLMGLKYSGIRITGARTRFGSCSPKNSLCFSWRLMQYPEEAVDYVVVHELAHTVHKNHGPRFYALIATVMPDWKRRRDLLKE